MKNIFEKNKAVLKFLGIFIGSYLILASLYHWYLQVDLFENYYPDFITNLVAVQTENLIEFFGYSSKISPHPVEASMRLFVNNEYLVRIIEGCNSVSVLILFISFIAAFHTDFKRTFLFAIAGSVLIYIFNLLRIVWLAIGIYHYPEYEELLHGTIFPAIIYGTVFLLWIIWVRIVSKTKKDE
ncbi:exosortase family protein XrtF [Mesonia maritima]|uniref:Exosortase family protein XrtF n=1 Tax=Mesonia maritima TaxID=1793873 RepID=A0ABU1KBM1_9FLAO|nr:exosortase family protein XrtF [Mesonia maritima]MDR6301963.1 exosortase family protein XrtF [Mesonia maritima]